MPLDAASIFSVNYATQKSLKAKAYYWACVLFCRRWLFRQMSREAVHREGLEFIIHSLHDQYSQEKRRLVRFVWPMFMAAIETTDPIQRTWLLARLYEIREASADCQWSWTVAKEMTELHSGPSESLVDLAEFMQLDGTTERIQNSKS